MTCSAWNLETIVGQAAALGYDGVELRGLGGKSHLPEVAELADDPAGVKQLFKQAGVQLVGLASSASFESWSRRVADRNRWTLTETIELAGRLECPYVSILLGQTQGMEHRATLGRVADQLRPMAELAARHHTTILVENAGDFLGSQDLWYVLDAVSHPALRGCHNPLRARLGGERPTLSVPRLSRRLAAFRMADGKFDRDGRFVSHQLPGEGSCELDRAIDLLKGVCFQGWLIFEWPQAQAELIQPEEALPKALSFMRERLSHTYERLSAYAKDKNPVNLKAPPSVATAPAT